MVRLSGTREDRPAVERVEEVAIFGCYQSAYARLGTQMKSRANSK
jgi:hypothetical protein